MAVDLVFNNNGIQFADGGVMSSTKQLGMQNRLHNALFNINQRTVSGTVTLAAGAYGHDRWKAGAGGCTYTFATVGNITTLTITAGTLQQVIEGANLESGTHCLSWVGTATARIDSGSYSTSGMTGTSVGGTNQTIEFSTGTVSLPQYEAGGNASAFGYRPIGLELALCKRYGRKMTLDLLGFTLNANNLYNGTLSFDVEMRATPTLDPGATFTVSSGSAGTVALNNATPRNATFGNSAVNWTANVGCQITGFLNAEL